MSEPLSRSQIDKLGARLRAGSVSDDDIRLLDRFKESVQSHTAEVATRVESTILGWQYNFTKRGQKTNPSIVQKLRRSSTALSQMQDISACRIIVPRFLDLADHARPALEAALGDVKVVDRLGERDGYRAIHIIAHSGFYHFEIQLRTRLQHAWAELSEKLADRFGQDLKYGAGPAEQKAFLVALSRDIAEFEDDEANYVIGYFTDQNKQGLITLKDLESPGARRATILRRITDAKGFL